MRAAGRKSGIARKVITSVRRSATLLYDELFHRDPALRSLFKPDMTEQRQKLMAMLATAVSNLGEWEKIATAVQALGRRHVGDGIKPIDYQTVGAALIATLEKGLGEDFTPTVRAAWLACIHTQQAYND